MFKSNKISVFIDWLVPHYQKKICTTKTFFFNHSKYSAQFTTVSPNRLFIFAFLNGKYFFFKIEMLLFVYFNYFLFSLTTKLSCVTWQNRRCVFVIYQKIWKRFSEGCSGFSIHFIFFLSSFHFFEGGGG